MKSDSRYHFVFLRHGESTGNAEKRHQGQADYPLTDLGREQAELLAEYWQMKKMSFDKAISSPLSRAKQTALILNKSLKIGLEYDPIWMERDNGKLAGLTWDEGRETFPPLPYTSLFTPTAETGESIWELYLRAGTALNELAKLSPGNYLIISHGGLLNMVIKALVGITPQANFQGPRFRFSNTGYTSVYYLPENNNWVIKEHNNTSHLDK
jgi:2,3-bisphosphoglycerate-dependent phosphoglycerate mutase